MKISTVRNEKTCLLVICLLFVVLSGFYSVNTPIFEALDELWHYPVVKNIADGSGLPILRPGESGNYWNQEGGQPPLYYLLSAAATYWIDTGDIEHIYRANPHATAGVPNSYDNKNMVIHSSAENFPYRGVPLAIHLIRFLSILMGLGTLLITYILARELIPRDPVVALGAAAFIAVLPEFLFVAGSVNNDNLINLLASASLLVVVRGLKHGIDKRSAVVLSVLVALSVLSKLSGLGLIGLVSLAGIVDAVAKRSWRTLLIWTLPVAITTILMTGWWFLRNWSLYHDPLGLNVWLQMVPRRPDNADVIQVILLEFQGFKMSFWGVFGGFNVLADGTMYRFYDVVTMLALAGLIFGLVQNRRARPRQALLVLICAAWLSILGISLLRWTQMTLASQARLMFPGISVVAIAFAFGLRSLPPRRLQPIVAVGIAIPLVATAALIPILNIAPAYPLANIIAEESLPGSIKPLYIDYAGKMELLGYDLEQNKVRPGENLDITLFWKILAPMDTDYSIFVHLFGRDNEPVGGIDSFPSGGAYTTREARPGDIIVDRHRVPVSGKAVAPSAVRIEAGVYSLPNFAGLDATDKSGSAIGTSPLLALIKLGADESDAQLRTTRRAADVVEIARFEDKMSLTGFKIQEKEASPGGTLSGSLTWRADKAGLDDYTIFVQLVSDNGLIAQFDSRPLRGYYPTLLWEPGEEIDDQFQMRIQPDVKEGEYDLIAGVYSLATGARLVTEGGAFAWLARITVR